MSMAACAAACAGSRQPQLDPPPGLCPFDGDKQAGLMRRSRMCPTCAGSRQPQPQPSPSSSLPQLTVISRRGSCAEAACAQPALVAVSR